MPGSSFTLGPDRRLRKHAEFVRSQRGGRRVGTKHFTLLVAPQASPRPEGPPGVARIGLVVARKIGGAVQRNRVKRLCRELFRTSPDLLPAGVDLVVIAREGAATLDLAALRAEWFGVQALLGKRAAEALARAATPHHPAASRP